MLEIGLTLNIFISLTVEQDIPNIRIQVQVLYENKALKNKLKLKWIFFNW